MTINDLYKDSGTPVRAPYICCRAMNLLHRPGSSFSTEILPRTLLQPDHLYGKGQQRRTSLIPVCATPCSSSEHQVVIIKKRISCVTSRNWNLISRGIVPTTILVIAYKNSSGKRRKVYKLISQKGVVFDSNKIYDRELPAFVDRLLKEKKLTIDDKGQPHAGGQHQE